jgi:hypothetical protein
MELVLDPGVRRHASRSCHQARLGPGKDRSRAGSQKPYDYAGYPDLDRTLRTCYLTPLLGNIGFSIRD